MTWMASRLHQPRSRPMQCNGKHRRQLQRHGKHRTLTKQFRSSALQGNGEQPHRPLTKQARSSALQGHGEQPRTRHFTKNPRRRPVQGHRKQPRRRPLQSHGEPSPEAARRTRITCCLSGGAADCTITIGFANNSFELLSRRYRRRLEHGLQQTTAVAATHRMQQPVHNDETPAFL